MPLSAREDNTIVEAGDGEGDGGVDMGNSSNSAVR